jgi:ubiquinone/menaquinone biosynthesis C-methylase UbiE
MDGVKRRMRDRYDELGGRVYDLRYMEEQRLKYEAVLQEVEIKPSDVVFDDGCGTGLLFEHVTAHMVGLDVSVELLGKARDRARETVHLVNGDSESLPFRPRVFDSVLSFTVLQNASSRDRMLREMDAARRDGGVLVVSILKKASSKQEFIELFIKSNLKIKKFFDNENVNDWMIISE